MTTSTTTRRVVEPAETPRRLHLPHQWLRALVAGAEAAVLSWLVVVVPAIATYVATASSPELGSAHWEGAARVGTVAWLLAHGAAPSVAQATISVVPPGLTLAAFDLLGSWRLRRAGLRRIHDGVPRLGRHARHHRCDPGGGRARSGRGTLRSARHTRTILVARVRQPDPAVRAGGRRTGLANPGGAPGSGHSGDGRDDPHPPGGGRHAPW